MRVAFRTDASSQIGLGHAMRCVALAQALSALGATVFFIARHMPASTAARIRDLGFGLFMLEPASSGQPLVKTNEYEEWLGVPWLADAEQTLQVLSDEGRVDWLVVDHYALDERWETVTSAATNHIAAIDDLDNRSHHCDLLIDHNPSLSDTPRYTTHTPSNCLRLLGPRYALLRPEFADARGDAAPVRNKLKRLLISLGGADPAGVTGHALAALLPLAFEGFALDVVLGSASTQRAAVEKAVAAIPSAKLHVDVADMTSLYLAADLAVGAAGTSVWERCSLGLPTILLTLADNQRAGAQALAERGACIHLGSATAQHMVAMTGLVRALAQSPGWLSILSRTAAAVCDGYGASRVAARMESFDMRLRAVVVADVEALWNWRNDEINRRYAIDPRPIPRDAHQEWFEARMSDDDCILLIAEDNVGPIGVLRYEIIDLRATVSVYLVPGRHGQGRGGVLLLAGERWLRSNRSDVYAIEAEILIDNQASLNVFAESGYVEQSRIFIKHLVEELR
ncbi:MAG TPA: UDP-2,4-diacetamido-2,4,6-trideoxy-beta-L-altropyranose hydrolase [Rhodocyclaceae bacterium]|nr:UDP-2,4-diacetamido-2,4,6-trideoxy-beta-L-altropyranose hydrolase [Rhodocyclaceae bacterium]